MTTKTKPTTRQHPAAAGAADHTRPDLLDRLLGCHDEIRERLDVLEDVGTDLLCEGRFHERHLATLCRALLFLDVVVPMHTADEEDTLFPELCRLVPEEAAAWSALENIQLDHQGHGMLELRLKLAVLRDDARAAGRLCLEIAHEYRYHLRKEEELLFPWAMEVITDPELLEQLAEEVDARRRDCGLPAP